VRGCASVVAVLTEVVGMFLVLVPLLPSAEVLKADVSRVDPFIHLPCPRFVRAARVFWLARALAVFWSGNVRWRP
jgi:hypothetical protein